DERDGAHFLDHPAPAKQIEGQAIRSKEAQQMVEAEVAVALQKRFALLRVAAQAVACPLRHQASSQDKREHGRPRQTDRQSPRKFNLFWGRLGRSSRRISGLSQPEWLGAGFARARQV